MATKIRTTDFPDSLTDGGWFIPTDYILIGPRLRGELMRFYTAQLPAASSVLDFNAGTAGLGPDLVAAGHSYAALEQNREVRELLASRSFPVQDWRPPRIPHADGSIDLALSLAFLEHLPTWIDALQQLLEVKRVLKPGGRFLIVAPNAPGMGATFWIDYKHGWIVSRKRLVDMAEEAGFEIASVRYSIGWITLSQGPLWAMARVITRFANAVLNLPPVARLLETVGLDGLAAKVRKTIFELVAVEIRKPNRPESASRKGPQKTAN